MIEIQIQFRADFVDRDSRDSARLAIEGQDVFWDGGFVGKVKCSYKTDDTSLGVFINMDKRKLPLQEKSE